jgi:hypothetical protein
VARLRLTLPLPFSRVDPKWVYEKGPTNVADALSRCPNLIHVARTQAKTCAHDLDSIPDKDAAPRKQSLEIQSWRILLSGTR